MNQKKVNYSDLSLSHLDFCIENSELFTDEHFSTIQYCNIEVLHNHFNIARKTYNELARAPRSNSYLNLGMGAGFLEYYIENHGKINIESVEWIEQTKNFSILLKKLNIEHRLTYECNDIRLDDFEIFNCNKTYDYIILTRFYPINKKHVSTVNDLENILKKLQKYSDKFIIFDDPNNYSEEIINYFINKKYDKLQLTTTDLLPWIIKL